MSEELEPISPQEARDILEAAIRERLGDNWEDVDDGWARISGHDYMARLVRGRYILDFYVDLLGNVRVEQAEENIALQSGRLFALIMLGLSIVIAILIVRIASGT